MCGSPGRSRRSRPGSDTEPARVVASACGPLSATRAVRDMHRSAPPSVSYAMSTTVRYASRARGTRCNLRASRPAHRRLRPPQDVRTSPSTTTARGKHRNRSVSSGGGRRGRLRDTRRTLRAQGTRLRHGTWTALARTLSASGAAGGNRCSRDRSRHRGAPPRRSCVQRGSRPRAERTGQRSSGTWRRGCRRGRGVGHDRLRNQAGSGPRRGDRGRRAFRGPR